MTSLENKTPEPSISEKRDFVVERNKVNADLPQTTLEMEKQVLSVGNEAIVTATKQIVTNGFAR